MMGVMDRARLSTPVIVLVVVAVMAACTGGRTTPTSVTSTPIATRAAVGTAPAATPRFALEPPTDWTGDSVALDELPPEAIETLRLIAADGPFPYDQDGGTFGNREGLLPDRASGNYREYTVETPGSSARGARRLVVGDARAVYYTDDHYESFRFVVP
jgi:ribonuclease T1